MGWLDGMTIGEFPKKSDPNAPGEGSRRVGIHVQQNIEQTMFRPQQRTSSYQANAGWMRELESAPKPPK